MSKKKSLIHFGLFSLAVSLELVVASGFSTNVQAQPANNTPNLPGSAIAQVTFDPPGDAQPTDTAGGASRGNGCPQEVTNVGGCVVPLMPTTQTGLTVAERPTFLAYIPETAAKELFFSLVDDNNQNHYQTKIALNGKSGIVSFQLPETAPALETGKNYKWTFIIIGEQGLRPDSPGVQGSIRRVQPNSALASQLDHKALVERAALYGKNGIWYDTVANLAEARRSQPNDPNLAVTWQKLLNSVGLQDIATQPLLN